MTGSRNGKAEGGILPAETARAKVNLALHVTGRRADGYHLIDSLVVFPDIGDSVSLEPGDGGLWLSGPYAHVLSHGGVDDNLVMKAARALAGRAGRDAGAIGISLDKRLPVASGIGGGSADAAAALRLLAREWSLDVNGATLRDIALSLGADVPMCLASRPARVRGVGEVIEPVPGMPNAGIVLVNPGVEVATPEVFRALRRRDNAGLPDIPAEGFASLDDLCDWLSATRNDLEPPAMELVPEIAGVLATLEGQGDVRCARMSGSGATCYALTKDKDAARALADRISSAHPQWWVAAGELG